MASNIVWNNILVSKINNLQRKLTLCTDYLPRLKENVKLMTFEAYIYFLNDSRYFTSIVKTLKKYNKGAWSVKEIYTN